MDELIPLVGYPIEESGHYETHNTLFGIATKWVVHATGENFFCLFLFFLKETQIFMLAALSIESNNTILNPLHSHFLYVWFNRGTISDYAKHFLSAYMSEMSNQTLWCVNLIFRISLSFC